MEKSNLSHEHKTVDLSVEQKELVSLVIKRFTSNVAGCIGEKSECLQTLLKALKSSFKIKESGDTVQMLLLKQVNF